MNAKKKTRFDADELVLLPLGGTGEIGMNCYCYGAGPANAREWLMVDRGAERFQRVVDCHPHRTHCANETGLPDALGAE